MKEGAVGRRNRLSGTGDFADGRRRILFEEAPAALLVVDGSGLCRRLTDLERRAGGDLSGTLNDGSSAARDLLAVLRVIDGNESALRLFGARGKAQLVQHAGALFVGESLTVRRAGLIHGGRALSAEVVAATADGKEKELLLSLQLPEPGKEANELLVGVVDLTRRANEVRRLRESEERYRQLVERTMVAMYRSTVDGRLIDCNEAFAELLGFGSREEALGHSVIDFYFQPSDREAFLDRLREHGRLIGEELTLRRSDGMALHVVENVSLTEDEEGGSAILDGTMLDVTESRQLREQLIRSQKLEAVGRLAGGIAHDFNNLLQAMLGIVQLELEGVDRGDQHETRMAELEQHVRRGAQLARQLLLFSRREATRREAVDLNHVVAEAARLLRRLVRENIEFHVELTPAVLRIRADRGQLEQVLMNLVVNATDAMPGGGRLTVRTRCEEVHAVLEVTDSGPGISETDMRRVFEPFFTTKEVGRGTGLGLAVVHGIVTAHGGEIEVDSTPVSGTVFRIRLGLTPAEVGEGEPGPGRAQGLPRGHGERVLVVEDDTDVRGALVTMLEGLGYEVEQAASPARALELDSGPVAFDLLLTDFIMPEMSGVELAVRLGKERPGMGVILLSGYTPDPAVLSEIATTGTIVLHKPCGLETLARALREVLERIRSKG